MKSKPLPVVMLSSQTRRGSETTIQALALGAVDFIAKPSEVWSIRLDILLLPLLLLGGDCCEIRTR